MLERLIQFILTYLIDKLISVLTDKWDEYRDDQAAKEEVNKKVKALKDAKTKEEFRTAISNLSL